MWRPDSVAYTVVAQLGTAGPTCVFFFQAEDGIRDVAVTGVQTCALPIYGDGLFEIDVLACGHDSFQVLRMKIRRRGDDNGVDFPGSGDFVESVWTDKALRGIDGGEAFRLLKLVEVGARGVELILKHVGERHNTRSAGVHQIGGVYGAAPAAAEQANANGGISVRAADELGLDKHQSGGGRGAADESAAVGVVAGGLLLVCGGCHCGPPACGSTFCEDPTRIFAA